MNLSASHCAEGPNAGQNTYQSRIEQPSLARNGHLARVERMTDGRQLLVICCPTGFWQISELRMPSLYVIPSLGQPSTSWSVIISSFTRVSNHTVYRILWTDYDF
jgi:hypothetical protein